MSNFTVVQDYLFDQATSMPAPYVPNAFMAAQHSLETGVLTPIFAGILGYPSWVLDDFALAGITHDIGKFHPLCHHVFGDNSTYKTPEYRLGRFLHPLLGVAKLEEWGMPSICIRTVLWHHENYDGLGQPLGLSGEQIPEWVHLIQLADYGSSTGLRQEISGLPASPMDRARHMYGEVGKMFPPDWHSRVEAVLDWYL